MKIDDIKKVMYKKGSMSIDTYIYEDINGVERCAYSGGLYNAPVNLTVDEYLSLEEKSGVEVYDFNEALELIAIVKEINYISEFVEITKEEYMDALEVLPPEKWKTVNEVEIFRMSEYLTVNITAHYAKYKGKYYVASRRTSNKYEDIANEVIYKYYQKN